MRRKMSGLADMSTGTRSIVSDGECSCSAGIALWLRVETLLAGDSAEVIRDAFVLARRGRVGGVNHHPAHRICNLGWHMSRSAFGLLRQHCADGNAKCRCFDFPPGEGKSRKVE